MVIDDLNSSFAKVYLNLWLNTKTYAFKISTMQATPAKNKMKKKSLPKITKKSKLGQKQRKKLTKKSALKIAKEPALKLRETTGGAATRQGMKSEKKQKATNIEKNSATKLATKKPASKAAVKLEPTPAKKPPVIKIVARTKSESVEKHTGKNWDQWIVVLKKAGADFWTFKEIVQFLRTKHQLSMWWQQIVANGFQVHTGIRQVGENSKGLYSVTMARNLNHSLDHVWKKFTSEEGIQIWLNPMGNFSLNVGAQFEIADGIYGELRTMMSHLRVRMKWINEDWPKQTYVQFYMHEFKPGKCMIVVSHGDLATGKIKEEMRLFWLERVSNFINFL